MSSAFAILTAGSALAASTPVTVNQAKAMLRQTWRIEAADAADRYYELEIRRVLSVRPFGARTKLGYRKFEVVVTVDVIEGFFLPEAPFYPYVSFCMVPQGKTWLLYGFEAIVGVRPNGRATLGCPLTERAKSSLGRPMAR